VSSIDQAKALFVEGLSLYGAARFAEAEGRFREADSLAPGRASILGNLSAALLRQDKVSEALQFARQALQIEPDNLEACLNLGACLDKQGRFEQALEHFGKAIALRPQSAEAWSGCGHAQAALKQYEQAAASYSKALALKPDSAEGWTRYAAVLKDLHCYDESLEATRKALALAPAHRDALLLHAVTLRKTHRYREAADHLRQLLAIDPGHAHAWLLLAVNLEEIKNYKAAMDAVERALSLQPSMDQAWYTKGTLNQNMGDYKAALACLDQAIKANPQMAVAWATRAGLHVASPDDPEGAIRASVDSLGVFLATEFVPEKVAETRISRATGALALPLFRIKHDVQQAQYLQSTGYDVPGLHAFLETGQNLMEKSRGLLADDATIPVTREQLSDLLPYWRAPLLYPMPDALPACLNPDNDWLSIEESYLAGTPEVVRIDNFLTPEALAAFQEYALVSKVWLTEYPDKYLGAFANTGFISRLHLRVASELRKAMPRVFLDYGLTQLWGFKYDTTLGKGINVHADFARVNLNFWITPDEYNLAPEAGGLKLYDVPSPADWSFVDFNVNGNKIYEFLDRHNARSIVVPHGCNRAVLFNSALFHETDRIRFAEGYRSRRVNFTYLFGKQL
jgi:tetratricopeptide (TPR) repeat protein